MRHWGEMNIIDGREISPGKVAEVNGFASDGGRMTSLG